MTGIGLHDWAAAGTALAWSAVTLALYFLIKQIYKRYPRWWTAPLIATPLALIGVLFCTGTDYAHYIAGTHWLVALMAPATVGFALPIYAQRHIMRRYWRTLGIGMLSGTALSLLSAWFLATWFGVEGSLRLSLLPRSVSTPFAMTMSGSIGGAPELTALFVILTGLWGAIFGEMILFTRPFTSPLARGASFGIGAHILGSNKAHEIDRDLGAIAALVMVLTGIFNVLIAPLVVWALQ